MPLFKSRARPRLTRLSTSSSLFRRKERQIYIYLFAAAILLIASVSILQLSLGRTSAHAARAADAKHYRRRANGREDLQVNRDMGEFGTAVDQEKQGGTEKARRKHGAELFDSRNLPKNLKIRSAGEAEVGNRLIEEEEEDGYKGKETQVLAEFDERESYLNDGEIDEDLNEERRESGTYQGQQLEDMDRFDDYKVTEDSFNHQGQLLEDMDKFENRLLSQYSYQHRGQLLEDMDKFDNRQVTQDSYKHQGQLLEDIDKFDNRQVTQDSDKQQGQLLEDMDKFDIHPDTKGTVKLPFLDAAERQYIQDLGESRGIERNRKYQTVGRNRTGKRMKEIPLVSKNNTRPYSQEGQKESRKLGHRRNYGRDMPNIEREVKELDNLDMINRSVADKLDTEDKNQLANTIKRVPEDAQGSMWAAVKQEMEKRKALLGENHVGNFKQEAGNPAKVGFRESNPSLASSHLKSVKEIQYLEQKIEPGAPLPLGGFKEFPKIKNASHENDDELLGKNVLEKGVKGEGGVLVDGGRSLARRFGISPWDMQRLRETGNVNPSNLLNGNKDNKDTDQSSMPALGTDEDHNQDSIESNALAFEKRTPDAKGFDQDKNLKVSVAQVHAEIMDVQSGKRQINQDQLHNGEDRSSEDGEELESNITNKDVSAVEENDGGDDDDEVIQWGFYPSLSRSLKFSRFLSAFFEKENCSFRVFMAWTTAPWAYTPRHQRAIESILHFHPHACIVVFTETIDFQFFDSWAKEGYKIAVARPNLEELLGKTPAIDFAYVWYEWRNMNLFYIHYTELLRIAALHKYGGVWLDMDMILARPLPTIHNVLGSTVSESGEWVLNGAFMSFDKSSSFLKACIEEFVATYDETSLGWNGADLLNRVASNATRRGGKTWLESKHLQVLEPVAFFPLSRHDIIRYTLTTGMHHDAKM
ncbi:uncharacterized protein [Physcomitrium patens]|uniref:uncharacterized protein isoform X3 n=1 Tax=Physcomitrium patens TaxID=3218 RepID=UPI000D1611F4|nr:uncharacterized protein LOC112276830 isoform X3 [Physcomitrium patens]|eukprot:XP_024364341.1 uncharacterized protein LOC112276830 isoform X3 [Physcomitrella patens]